MGPLISRGQPLPASVTLVLPEDMREELRRPLGPVVSEDGLAARAEGLGAVATVGDMTTLTAHRMGIRPHLAVVDFHTKRVHDPSWKGALASVGEVTMVVGSSAGELSPGLYNAILEAWRSGRDTKVVVEGEEDLAALPAILHAPEGATVIYGIPDTGLCLVQVDEGARDVVTDVLRRMDVHTGKGPPQGGRQDGTGDRL